MKDREGGDVIQVKKWPLEKCGNTRFTVVVDENLDMTLHESKPKGRYDDEALPTQAP